MEVHQRRCAGFQRWSVSALPSSPSQKVCSSYTEVCIRWSQKGNIFSLPSKTWLVPGDLPSLSSSLPCPGLMSPGACSQCLPGIESKCPRFWRHQVFSQSTGLLLILSWFITGGYSVIMAEIRYLLYRQIWPLVLWANSVNLGLQQANARREENNTQSFSLEAWSPLISLLSS